MPLLQPVCAFRLSCLHPSLTSEVRLLVAAAVSARLCRHRHAVGAKACFKALVRRAANRVSGAGPDDEGETLPAD